LREKIAVDKIYPATRLTPTRPLTERAAEAERERAADFETKQERDFFKKII
jgi:hypothetical protein